MGFINFHACMQERTSHCCNGPSLYACHIKAPGGFCSGSGCVPSIQWRTISCQTGSLLLISWIWMRGSSSAGRLSCTTTLHIEVTQYLSGFGFGLFVTSKTCLQAVIIIIIIIISWLRADRNRLMRACNISCIRAVHQGPVGSVTELVNLLMATNTAYCSRKVQAGT